MSRLMYAGDTIQNFGKFLPTPIIESIKIEFVKDDDPLIPFINKIVTKMKAVETSDHLVSPPLSFDTIEASNLSKITLQTSALFNSSDVFDSQAFFDDLLDTTGTNSLFLNIFVYKDDAKIKSLKDDKLNLGSLRESVVTTGGIANFYPGISGLAGTESADDHVNYIKNIFNGTYQVYSVPFSEFITNVNFTSDFDDNGNPVIKSSYTTLKFHVLGFQDIKDLTIFACISTEKFNSLSNSPITKSTFALNFSDITYEDVRVNNVVARFGDPVYVDSDGLPYAKTPIQALDGKFYKSDNITHLLIESGIKDVLNKYRTDAESSNTSSLNNQFTNIEYVLARYGKSIDLLPNLNKANKLSPNKTGTTSVGRMYDDLRVTITNLNTAVLGEPQVVKRVYRNYKIVDMRGTPEINIKPSYSNSSLVHEPFDHYQQYIMHDCTNSYKGQSLHSSVAKYVPVVDGLDWPGKAELPITSEEARNFLDGEAGELIQDLKSIVTDIAPETHQVASGDSYNNLFDDIKDFLDTQADLWAKPGTWYYNEGELSGKTEKKMKKKVDKGKYDGYSRHSGLSDNAFLSLYSWLRHSDKDPWELVFYRGKNNPRPGYEDFEAPDDGLSKTEAQKVFRQYYDHVLGLHPPWYHSFSKKAERDEVQEYVWLKKQTSKAKNWDPGLILNACVDRMDRSGDTLGTGAGDDGGERYSRVIDSAIQKVFNTMEDIISDEVESLRNNPGTLTSMEAESTRREIATSMYTRFYNNAVGVINQNINIEFDAYIRCPCFTGIFSVVDHDVSYENFSVGNMGAGGTLSIIHGHFPKLTQKRSGTKWIYRIPFGNIIAGATIRNLNNKKNDIIDLLMEILLKISTLEGSGLDTGLHDALAATDIIIQKNGFFFVDLEKYIRKKSFLSRYIDVNKFVNYFPIGREATSNAIQIRKATYHNKTYNVVMSLDDDPGTSVYKPSKPYQMTFQTAARTGASEGAAVPMVYRKVPRINVVSFAELFNFEGGDLPVASAQRLEGDGVSDVSEIPSGGGVFTGLGGGELSSKLIRRNYAWPGNSENDWFKENYRLAMYEYNFFIDDDEFDKSVRVEGEGSDRRPEAPNSSLDYATITAVIKDESYQTLMGIIEFFSKRYQVFNKNYYQYALQQCSYDEYNQRFNNFFVDGILEKFPDGGPYIDMVSTYVHYIDLLSDYFNESTALPPTFTEIQEKLDFGTKLLDTIRPETGTLGQLIVFNDALVELNDRLQQIKADATERYTSYNTNREIYIDTIIENPILDHIGDYESLADRFESV